MVPYTSLKDRKWRWFDEFMRLAGQKTSGFYYDLLEKKGDTENIMFCKKYDQTIDEMLKALEECKNANP